MFRGMGLKCCLIPYSVDCSDAEMRAKYVRVIFKYKSEITKKTSLWHVNDGPRCRENVMVISSLMPNTSSNQSNPPDVARMAPDARIAPTGIQWLSFVLFGQRLLAIVLTSSISNLDVRDD